LDSVRFQFDECVSNDIADKLRELGVDVITAHEAGMRGQPDYIALAHAYATRRVMVTHDRDFLRLSDAGQPQPVSPTANKAHSQSLR
jgi:predicted nuclease of predicted toxin-antitoxin system